MQQHVQVLAGGGGASAPEPEPTPEYVKWRNRAIACVILFVVAAHALVWFSTWSDQKGNSYMEVCGIWLVVSGIAGIGSTMAYVECKDRYRHNGRSHYW